MERQRSSVRSRDSSSTTASAGDVRERLKDCCRKIVAFMCTQVGVGGLIVGYALAGAASFISIETAHPWEINAEVDALRANYTAQLWEIAVEINNFNSTEWHLGAEDVLRGYSREVAEAVKHGYNMRDVKEVWTFPAALMFCLSVFTMIGFGNLYPRSDAGKRGEKRSLRSPPPGMLSADVSARLGTPVPGGPIRLNSIKGYQNRTNNVIYCPPLVKSPKEDTPTAVVYFGGDVQDVPENMESNRDTKSYMKYNLENTAVLLRESFPRAHIIVVQPARMEYTTFSCFDNFVRGNCAGIPDHTPMHYALQHLEELLSNISKKLTKFMSESDLVCKLTASTTASTTTTPVQVAAAVDSGGGGGAGVNPPNSNSIAAAADNVVQTNHNQAVSEMDIDIVQVPPVETPPPVVPMEADGCNDVAESPVVDGSAVNSDSVQAEATPEMLQSDIQATITPCGVPQSVADVLWWRENLNFDKANLALVGFSKGCVVLNQFIYEFHYLKTLTPDDSSMMRLVSRIKDMYWLDGGHGGGKNTWITSRSLLETLCRLGINIHVHVTPYQVQDDHRPWIRKEEKTFTDLLKRLGAPLTRHLHATDSSVSNLFTHFEVLHGFKKFQHQILLAQPSAIRTVAAAAQQQYEAQQAASVDASSTTASSIGVAAKTTDENGTSDSK